MISELFPVHFFILRTVRTFKIEILIRDLKKVSTKIKLLLHSEYVVTFKL